MSDKHQVRAAALSARRGTRNEAADTAIVVGAVDFVRGRQRIAAYVPMPGEPGGSGLLDALAEVVETVLLPVRLPDNDLDWAVYQGELSTGRLREPTGPRLGPDAIARVEVVLVPAVAVDDSGMRIGRGGGSYDRALARVQAGVPTVALLYDGEIVAHVPAESHDRPVTAALTPSGLHRFPR
jgi:5-formyltetrahydrofolate cyclo-ligase